MITAQEFLEAEDEAPGLPSAADFLNAPDPPTPTPEQAARMGRILATVPGAATGRPVRVALPIQQEAGYPGDEGPEQAATRVQRIMGTADRIARLDVGQRLRQERALVGQELTGEAVWTRALVGLAEGTGALQESLGGAMGLVYTVRRRTMPSLFFNEALRTAAEFHTRAGRAKAQRWAELGQGVGGGPVAEAAEGLAATAVSSAPAIPAAVAGGLPAAVAVAGAQQAGSTWSEAREALRPRWGDQADLVAVPVAAVSGAITAGVTRAFGATGIEALAKGFTKQTARQMVREGFKQAGLEATEEMVDQTGQEIWSKLTYNPQTTVEQAVKNVLFAGAAGGILGGGTQVGSQAVNRIAEPIENRMALRDPRLDQAIQRSAADLANRASLPTRDVGDTRFLAEIPAPDEATTLTAPESSLPTAEEFLGIGSAVTPEPSAAEPVTTVTTEAPPAAVEQLDESAPWETEGGLPGEGETEDATPDALPAKLQPPPVDDRITDYPVMELPVQKIRVSKDVPNFKENADPETGEVAGQELRGQYIRLGTGPIVVWERLDGTWEVITGRHRLALARRAGEQTIPGQLVREADGFTKERALTFDAESNIRAGQGTTKDYAHYFRNTRDAYRSREEAESRGLLSRAKGNHGWDIGHNASDDVYALFAAAKINEAQTLAIVRAAPDNPTLQAIGAKAALAGQPADVLGNFIQAVRLSTQGQSAQSLDLFGSDDSAMKEAEAQGRRAAMIQRALREQITAVQGAARKPEVARKLGVDVSNPDGVRQRLAEIRAELERWATWWMHPDLAAQVRQPAGAGAYSLAEDAWSFDAPESVADQKQRQAREAQRAQAKAGRQKMADRASQRLVGTRGDLGQGDLLGGGDLFSRPSTPSTPDAGRMDAGQMALFDRGMQQDFGFSLDAEPTETPTTRGRRPAPQSWPAQPVQPGAPPTLQTIPNGQGPTSGPATEQSWAATERWLNDTFVALMQAGQEPKARGVQMAYYFLDLARTQPRFVDMVLRQIGWSEQESRQPYLAPETQVQAQAELDTYRTLVSRLANWPAGRSLEGAVRSAWYGAAPYSLAPWRKRVPTRLTDVQLRQLVENFRKDPAAPAVRVVHDPAWRVNGFGVQGTVEDGVIVLNTAYLGDVQTAGRVLREEHAHTLLGSEAGQAEIRAAVDTALAEFSLENLAGRYQRQPGEDYGAWRRRLIEEQIAKGDRDPAPWWRRVLDRIRAWLARHGLATFTPEEVGRAIMRRLRERATPLAPETWQRLWPSLADAPITLQRPVTPAGEDRNTMRLRHIKIVTETAAPVPADERAEIWFSGGGPGAGKSTILQELEDAGEIPKDHVYISADDFKEGRPEIGLPPLPEYGIWILDNNPGAANGVHKESTFMAKSALARAIMERKHVVYDATFSNFTSDVELLKWARDAGYQVNMMGVYLDPDAAVKRAMLRAQNSRRHVYEPVVRAGHQGFSQAFAQYLPWLDRVLLFDNNGRRQRPTRLIASMLHNTLAIGDRVAYGNFGKVGDPHVELPQTNIQTIQGHARKPGQGVRGPGGSRVDRLDPRDQTPGGEGAPSGRGLGPERNDPLAGGQHPGRFSLTDQPSLPSFSNPAEPAIAPEENLRRASFNARFETDPTVAAAIRAGAGEQWYAQIPNELTAAQAATILKQWTLPVALDRIRDESAPLSHRVRVALAEAALRQLDTEYKAAEASGQARDAAVLLDRAVGLAEWTSDYGTRLGQGVQAFAMWSHLSPEGFVRTYRRAVDRANAGNARTRQRRAALKGIRKAVQFDPDLAKRIYAAARDALKKPAGFQRDEAVADVLGMIARAKGISFWDVVSSIWYANVLSGVATQVRNTAGNLQNLVGEAVTHAAVHPTAAPALFSGLFLGAYRGALDAGAVLRTGKVTGTRVTKVEQPRVLELIKFRGPLYPLNAWKYVFRAMAATDMLFFRSAEEMKSYYLAKLAADQQGLRGSAARQRVADLLWPGMTRADAVRQAAREKLTGLAARRRIEELLREGRPETLVQQAADYGRFATYNQAPEGVIGALVRAVNQVGSQVPLLRMTLVPFTNVVGNVMNNALNYTPWGYATLFAHRYPGILGKIGERSALDASPDEFKLQAARATLGTLGMTALGALAFANLRDDDPPFALTATGPRDPNHANQLRETGWKPYTVKVGGAFFDFRTSPLAPVLAVLGQWSDAMRYNQLEAAPDSARLAYALQSVAHVMLSQSFLSSLAEFIGDVTRPTISRRDVPFKGFARTASTFLVPNVAREIDRIFDPRVYDTPTIEAALASQFPVVRSQAELPVRRNLLGEVIRLDAQPFVSPVRPSPVWQLIARNQAWISTPSRQTMIHDRPITPAEYDRLIRTSGQAIKARLADRLPLLRYLPRAEVQAEVQALVRDERAKAKRLIEANAW